MNETQRLYRRALALWTADFGSAHTNRTPPLLVTTYCLPSIK